MMIEGAGWEVIDLGVDVSTDKFKQAAREPPGCCDRTLCTTHHNHGEHATGLSASTEGRCTR
ncbi:MAG: hypothetical protein MZV63_52385 [Marinilabiliales bacterium]|nr:hypothetical protein [Marinilabiliales bacterium]